MLIVSAGQAVRPPTTYSHSTAYSHSRAIALASTGLSSGTPQDATVQDLMKVVMQQSEMRSVADVRSQHTDSYAFPQKTGHITVQMASSGCDGDCP